MRRAMNRENTLSGGLTQQRNTPHRKPVPKHAEKEKEKVRGGV
jgi:hypothetical protein